MSAVFMVRAQVVDASVKDAFDRWYAEEHLPDALKTKKRPPTQAASRGPRAIAQGGYRANGFGQGLLWGTPGAVSVVPALKAV